MPTILDRDGCLEALAEASHLLEDDPDPQQKVTFLAEIAVTYRWIGSRAQRSQILASALQVAQDMPNAEAKDKALASIAISHGRCHDFEGATQTALQIEDPSLQNQELHRIEYFRNLTPEPAMPPQTTEQICQVADNVTDPRMKALELCKASKLFAERGDVAGCRAALAEAHEAAAKLDDPWQRAYVLGTIAVSQSINGDEDDYRETMASAFQIADEIADPNEKVSSLAGYAIAQARAGKHTESEATLADLQAFMEAMPDPDQRSNGHGPLVTAYLSLDDFEQAHNMAQRVADLKNRIWLLVTIAKAQVKAGEFAGSRATLQDAQQTVMMQTDPWHKIAGLILVAKRQAKRVKEGSGDVQHTD